MDKKIINVSSEKQSGGITGGIINNKEISIYTWKGRKQGFFFAVAVGILIEIIIRLIF